MKLRSLSQKYGSSRVLSRREEQKLFRRYRSKQARTRQQALDLLVSHNIRLVISIARTCEGRGLELEDLIQEGVIGLMRAIELFEPERGNKFSPYAIFWIKRNVYDALKDKGKTIRVSHRIWENLSKVNRARKELLRLGQEDPTLAALSEKSGLSVQQITLAEESGKLLLVSSIDAPVENKDGKEWFALDPVSSSISPETKLSLEEDLALSLEELALLRRRILASFPKGRLAIYERHYGFDGSFEPQNLAAVGRQFELTRERARQIVKAINDQLNLEPHYSLALAARIRTLLHLCAEADAG